MITIRTHNQTRSQINWKPYLNRVRLVLPKYGITDNVEVELRIVGRLAMRRLNQQHRGKDYPTDVLSFPVWPDLASIKARSGLTLLGSIVVCLPVAKKQADEENQSIEDQIAFLIEHSLLHLLGFHHEGD